MSPSFYTRLDYAFCIRVYETPLKKGSEELRKKQCVRKPRSTSKYRARYSTI